MSLPAAEAELPSAPVRPARTVVHKFGGTSVADAERYRHVARLLLERDEALQVTVVSAMKGVTDALIELAHAAGRGGDAWRDPWHDLRARHRSTAVALLAEQAGEAVEWIDRRFDELARVLEAVSVLGSLPEEVLQRVQGLGEVYSAQLLGMHLRALGQDVAVLDAREVLVVSHGELGVDVDWERSAARLEQWRRNNPQPRVVATGFVARDAQGRVTTLGRNGSDYSGAIFARLFGADELHIWTDVDGVLSADPRVVPEAVQLEALSYDEACELAYFGAKVVHPQTMAPAMELGLPIIIRNTFRPEHPGTRIAAERDGRGPVKGLTLSPNLALLNLEGTGLIGVPGTAGFISKWYLVLAAMEKGQWWLVGAILASSLLAVAYVWRFVEVAYFREPLAHHKAVGEAQLRLLLPAALLIAATLWLGFDTSFTVGSALDTAEQLLRTSR